MSRFTLLIIALLSVLLPAPGNMEASSDSAADELFFEANRAYKNDRYQEAADGYLNLIEKGFKSGHIYYNLGNAYFQLGDLGRAILYYERARLLIPRNDDLRFNLSHANDQTRDAVDDDHAFPLYSLLGLDSVNQWETFLFFAVLNFFFFGTLCIRLFKKSEWTYYLSILFAIFISIGLCGFGLKWFGLAADNRAVILSKEVEVRAGPDPEDTVLFKIHEGAVVHYERPEDGWALIHLSKDKRGWVQAVQVERILN